MVEITIGTDLTKIPKEEIVNWLKTHTEETGGYRVWQDTTAYLACLAGIPKYIEEIKSAIVGQRFEISERNGK